MPTHRLINFEIQNYYQNERKSIGVSSRNSLPKAYVINIDEFNSIETHWVALHVYCNNIKYFDSFGVENIPKEIKKFIENKNILTNIFRIQAYDSIICGFNNGRILLYCMYWFYVKTLAWLY